MADEGAHVGGIDPAVVGQVVRHGGQTEVDEAEVVEDGPVVNRCRRLLDAYAQIFSFSE